MIDRIRERSEKEGFLHSRLPEFTPDEIEYIRGTFDFFSLNTYTTSLAQWQEDEEIGSPSWSKDTSVYTYQDPAWESTASDWLKVVPWGARKLLNWVANTYGDPEILITENGMSDTGELDDQQRINFYAVSLFILRG